MNLKVPNLLGFLTFLINLYSLPVSTVLATKIDCHPTSGANEKSCVDLGCIWQPVQLTNKDQRHVETSSFNSQKLPFDLSQESLVGGGFIAKSNIQEPWCYFPDNYNNGYKVVEHIESGNRVKIVRDHSSGLENDIKELMVDVENYGPNDSMVRLRIYDANRQRYEPEIPVLQTDAQPKLHSSATKDQFSFQIDQQGHLIIKRKSTGAIVFDTDLKKLIFTDQFIQLNSKLNSPFLYGLGEHYDTFLKMANSYKTYSFYHYDTVPLPDGRRTYGSFPFYINLDSENQQYAHGVYLRNSNGMDIILQSDQSITFRPIGGILDFIIFSGPTPQDVISQYQHLVGLPDLPPRWALGFHLCRYGWGSLNRTMEIWNRTRAAGIPFDVQWNDIDNMQKHNDFTYDPERFKGLPEFINELHDMGMHYMLLFDPGLSQEDNYYPYTLGLKMDIFVKNATNQTLVGKVWNDSGRTVFPDFSNKLSIDYWTELFIKFQKEIAYDGAWIDMNDISNFVYGSLDGCPKDLSVEKPPYLPGGFDLQTHSLCLSAKHRAGNEYDVHNLYSFYEAIATRNALEAARPNKRPFVISRSTSVGQGHFGGHWSGDVLSTWDYLRWSIPSLIEHSMYGFSMMGSDICGFTGNTNVELCARWSTLGAFYTFTRNHNDDRSADQDPVALGPVVVQANKNALSMKYSLVPYLYSLIYRAHLYGEPAIRAVPFEFYAEDKEALKVEYQFMWGKGLMISPVVEQNTYTKSTYLPKGRWYETDVRPEPADGIKVPMWIDSKGEWYETKGIALTNIPLFYRGGNILPIYPEIGQTIAQTVQKPLGLLIALCPMNKAHGELYQDDGDNVDGKHNHLLFKYENNSLTITLDHDDYQPSASFGQVKVLGLSSVVNGIKVNNTPVSFARYDHMLIFSLAGNPVTKDQQLTVNIY